MYKIMARIFRDIVGFMGLLYAWSVLATGFILFPTVVSLCDKATIAALSLESGNISTGFGKFMLGLIPIETLLTFTAIAAFIGYKAIRYVTTSKSANFKPSRR